MNNRDDAKAAAERERAEADAAAQTAGRERAEADEAAQVAAREQAEAEQAMAQAAWAQQAQAEAQGMAEQEAMVLAKATELAMAQIAAANPATGQGGAHVGPAGLDGGLHDLEPESEPVDEEREAVRRAFEDVDTDRSGTLDKEEVRALTQILGRNVSDNELKAMMREMDGDGGGDIDFAEFFSWWNRSNGSGSPGGGELKATLQAMGDITRADVKDAFDAVDTDRGGTLDRQEVRKLSENLGRPVDDSELAKMMSEMDADGSGEVDFNEFYAWFAKIGTEGGSEAGKNMRKVRFLYLK